MRETTVPVHGAAFAFRSVATAALTLPGVPARMRLCGLVAAADVGGGPVMRGDPSAVPYAVVFVDVAPPAPAAAVKPQSTGVSSVAVTVHAGA